MSISNQALRWRRPGIIFPLESFQDSRCHRRGTFNPQKIQMLSKKKMAGYAYQPSLIDLQQRIQHQVLSEDDKGYLHELWTQFGDYSLRCYLHYGGVTVYEMASAMRDAHIQHRSVTSWINRFSAMYEGEDLYENIPNLEQTPWN